MCRTGGRRCPSHTDPTKVAAYNQRRRELYTLRKNIVIDSRFQPLNQTRPNLDPKGSSVEAQAYASDSAKYLVTIHSEYDDGNGAEEALMMLGEYTIDAYEDYRDYLNGYQVLSDGTHAKIKFGKIRSIEIQEGMGDIDKLLDLAPKPEEPRILYRGLSIPRNIAPEKVGGWLKKHFPVGGVISQKNYMSTTVNPAVATYQFTGLSDDRAVVFEILSKQGAPIGEGLSLHGDEEMEVLMPRDAKFRVVSVHEKVDYKTHSEGENQIIDSEPRTVVRLIDVNEEN